MQGFRHERIGLMARQSVYVALAPYWIKCIVSTIPRASCLEASGIAERTLGPWVTAAISPAFALVKPFGIKVRTMWIKLFPAHEGCLRATFHACRRADYLWCLRVRVFGGMVIA